MRSIIGCYVALFASAWIETAKEDANHDLLSVALFASAWIETLSPSGQSGDGSRRALRERVD